MMVILILVIASYEWIDELSLRGIWVTRFPSTKPYSWSEVYPQLVGATSRDPTANLLLERLRRGAYKGDGYGMIMDARFDTLVIGRSTLCGWAGTGDVFALIEPSLKIGKDGLYPDNYWREKVALDYVEGYAEYFRHYWCNYSLFLGRSHLEWGPGANDNMVISGNNPLFDAFNVYYIFSNIKLSWFFTRLDDVVGDSIEYKGDTLVNLARVSRYLAGHRVEISFPGRLVAGFSEVVVHSPFEIYYLVPVLFYLPLEVNRRPLVNHNYVWGFDIRVWIGGISLYGEILVDDFQYQEDQWKEPNHLGLNCGLGFVDPLGVSGVFVSSEYSCASRWVYTHPIVWHRYEYRGYPIGHPLAPDFDRLWIGVVYHLSRGLDLSLKTEHIREGETHISSRWPIPYPHEPGYEFPGNNFLSGVVEKRIKTSVGGKLFIRPEIWVGVDVGYERVWNYGHSLGKGKGFPVFGLNIGIYR